MTSHIYDQIAKKFPFLSLKLEQSGSIQTPAEFIQKISTISIMMGIGIGIFGIFGFLTFEKPVWYVIPITLLCIVVFFFNLLNSPEAKIGKFRKQIDREILFVGTFMVAELDAGVPIYQVLRNIEVNYPGVKKYMRGILNEVDLGTSIDKAISSAIITNPSIYFQKVMYQVANSLKTGSDISSSLAVVLDQINRRQIIEVETYSKKLSPIALFYLMVAVIFPSIGMVMLIIVASFIGFPITLPIFLIITFLSLIIQGFFVTIIESNRPAVEM